MAKDKLSDEMCAFWKHADCFVALAERAGYTVTGDAGPGLMLHRSGDHKVAVVMIAKDIEASGEHLTPDILFWESFSGSKGKFRDLTTSAETVLRQIIT